MRGWELAKYTKEKEREDKGKVVCGSKFEIECYSLMAVKFHGVPGST